MRHDARMDAEGYWLAGRRCDEGASASVVEPGTGRVVGEYVVPPIEVAEVACKAAAAARAEFSHLSTAGRALALTQIADGIQDAHGRFTNLIASEAGKPQIWASAEVDRAIKTFRLAADEARQLEGTFQPLDLDDSSVGRAGIVRRFPRGPVLAITPFNFPLNLVAHKVAPALAVGASVVVKPSPRTPLTSLALGEVLWTADLPAGAFSVVPGDVQFTNELVTAPEFAVVSFTGSDVVGREIAEKAWDKRIVLELGGNATAIVCADYESEADLKWAANRIATFAMYQAGQSCISVQRLLVSRELVERLRPLLLAEITALGGGSAEDPGELVGPLIDQGAAERVSAWIDEAVADGATLLCGGVRSGSYVTPTLMESVPESGHIWQDEVFGPVLAMATFDEPSEAFDAVNASRFGLQCGVFTHRLDVAFEAFRSLDVGGVIIGDVPSFRSDAMPYGGSKDSGRGREGVRSSIREYTEERVMVVRGAL